jgi:hypothetical protein
VPQSRALLAILFWPVAAAVLLEHRSRRLIRLGLSLVYQYAMSGWRRVTGSPPPAAITRRRDPLEGLTPRDPDWGSRDGATPSEPVEATAGRR